MNERRGALTRRQVEEVSVANDGGSVDVDVANGGRLQGVDQVPQQVVWRLERQVGQIDGDEVGVATGRQGADW
jgi:hypothetical protein